MERKQWLTMVYREANIFIERHANDGHLTESEVEELEPELHDQLKEVIGNVDFLEDLIKHSLLKNPPPDLWYGENEWPHVVASVASCCLVHDVQGVILKILAGDLPQTPSEKLLDPL
ncbi:MAG: hypothetical protein WCT04_07460 [Planctomycetota bacterium]